MKAYLDAVKFAPCLSKPLSHQADTEQPPMAQALPPSSFSSDLPPQSGPNSSKWDGGRARPRRFRLHQSGVIRTGPLRGLSKRVPTEKRRALDLGQVRSVVNAAAFAERQGQPLNARLDITWRESPLFRTKTWQKLQGEVFDHMTRFLRRRGIRTAFVWVRERAEGKGAHSHAALHLGPRPKEVKADLVHYLTRKFRFSGKGIRIGMGAYGAHTPAMRAGILRYITKGIDHRAFRYTDMDGSTENIGAALGIRHQGEQGIIEIKRCGTSQNIGPAARSKAGWTEIRGVDGLRRALNPGCDDGDRRIEDVGPSRKALAISTKPRRTLRPDASISALR